MAPATFPDCFSPLETSREASESLLGILRAIKAWNVLNVAEIDAYGRVLSLLSVFAARSNVSTFASIDVPRLCACEIHENFTHASVKNVRRVN